MTRHQVNALGLGRVAGLTVPLACGVAVGTLMPYGPVTASQALLSLAGGVVVGLVAGFFASSRWTPLLAAALFWLAFEVARLPVHGATVDWVNPFAGFYGALAFALGRVFPFVLMGMPLIVGAVCGSALGDLWRQSSLGGTKPADLVVAGVVTLALAGLAVVIARPASTQAVMGGDGRPLADSVAELRTVQIGGVDQVVMIRGRDDDNPVLLYLAGGPGGTDIGAVRADVTLEQDFTVAVWDQRGAGKSYAALGRTEALSVELLLTDTIEVVDYLRARFGQERIYLVGQSWGSLLGVMAVHRYPERFHAFVGVGQMVSPAATDVMFWEDTLAWAERVGDARLVERLRSNGPPPYHDLLAYEHVNGHEHDWNAYSTFDASNEMPQILFVPEYDLMDKVNAFRGFLDSAAALYPQLQDVDLRVDVDELAVPVTLVVGEHEARGRAVLAAEWFESLAAPTKRSEVVEAAGHRANFDDPSGFAAIMRTVRDAVAVGR